jgi:hypothetical protein
MQLPRETYFWAMMKHLQLSLPYFKLGRTPVMATSYSPLLSALSILLLHSNGVSIAFIKLGMMVASLLYSEAPSNISTLMGAKMAKISSECSRLVMGLRFGFSNTLELIQAFHFVLLEALSKIKKSLSLNIKVVGSLLSTQELL